MKALFLGQFAAGVAPRILAKVKRGPFAPGNGPARPPLLKRPTGILRPDVSSRWWRIATALTYADGGQVPALIAVFELAGTAVALQRHTEMVRPDRHAELP